MDILKIIIEEIRNLYTVYVFLVVTLIGILTILIDYNRLKKQKLYKDAKIAKIIGLAYLIGGPVLYIVFKII